MTLTDYADTTPDVAVTYDALGRQLTQSNGVAKCTYAYHPGTLAPDTETIAYDLTSTARWTSRESSTARRTICGAMQATSSRMG